MGTHTARLGIPGLKSRFEGCLLGGAIGDALGAPVEFQTASSIFATYGPKGVPKCSDLRMALKREEGGKRAEA